MHILKNEQGAFFVILDNRIVELTIRTQENLDEFTQRLAKAKNQRERFEAIDTIIKRVHV